MTTLRRASQYATFFIAPAVFLVHLQVAYMLVPWSCHRQDETWLHVVTLAAIIVAALGGWLGWRVWEMAGRRSPGSEAGDGPPDSRARMIAVMGIAMSSFVVLMLAAQWAPAFVLSPCQ